MLEEDAEPCLLQFSSKTPVGLKATFLDRHHCVDTYA